MSTTDPILVEAYKFVRGGQFKAARQNLRQAIKNNPNSQRAWLLMSMAVTDTAQQQECLRRVLSLNPGNTEAQQRLAQLQPTETIAPESTQAESLEASASEPHPEIEPQPSVVEEIVEEPLSEAIAPQPEPEPESEPEVVAVPVESGVAEAEPVLEAVAETAAEVAPPVEEASAVEPPAETTSAESWSSEPQGLPEWLVAQSLIDETLPDVEPVAEEEYEEENDDELESEADVEVAEAINAESAPTAEAVTADSADATPPSSSEEAAAEPAPPPRAKRRRARRLHTDYLRTHQMQAEDDLPAWLKEEAEMSTHPPVAAKPAVTLVGPPPNASVAMASAVVSPVAPTPAALPPANLEPAPIRVQPPRVPAAPTEKEPMRPYYSTGYAQGDVPSWALPVLLILLTLVVMGLVALLIYMVL